MRMLKQGMRTLMPIFLFILLFSVAVTASFTNEWGEYQDDESNRGFVHDESGTFEGVGIVDVENIGNDFQPLIIDWDGDASLDVIVFTTTFISVHDENLDVKDQLNIIKTPLSQPTFYLNGTDEFLALIVSDELRVYDYNGTDIFLINSTPINTTQNQVTGIKFAHSFLYFASSINTTQSNFYKIRGDTFEVINTTTFAGNVTHNPAIADIDIDSVDEIAFVCDTDLNGQWGLCVFDGDLGNFEIEFSTDGIIDDLHTKGDDSFVTSPIMFNVDGTTDTEIIFARSVDGTCGGVAFNYLPTITAYNNDGSSKWSVTGNTGTIFPGCPNDANDPYWASQPFIAFDDTQRLICFVSNGDTNNEIWEHLGCLNALNGTVEWSSINPLTNVNIIEKDIVSGAAFSRITNEDYVVFGQFIYRVDGTFAANITPQIDGSYEYSLADLNADGNLDIIYSSSSLLKAAFSNFTNLVPTLTNVRINTGNPVCQHETVTFSSLESSSDYTNDNNEDLERLQVELPNGTFYNGSFDLSAPLVSLPFNETGTFALTIYLQDEANPSDLTQFMNYVLTVSSNILVCNPAGSEGTTTTEEETETEDLGEDVLGSFGLSVDAGAKALVWVVVAIWLGVVTAGGGLVSVIFVEIAWVAGGVLMSLIPAWIPIMIGFVAAAIITLSLFGGGSNGGV